MTGDLWFGPSIMLISLLLVFTTILASDERDCNDHELAFIVMRTVLFMLGHSLSVIVGRALALPSALVSLSDAYNPTRRRFFWFNALVVLSLPQASLLIHDFFEQLAPWNTIAALVVFTTMFYAFGWWLARRLCIDTMLFDGLIYCCGASKPDNACRRHESRRLYRSALTLALIYQVLVFVAWSLVTSFTRQPDGALAHVEARAKSWTMFATLLLGAAVTWPLALRWRNRTNLVAATHGVVVKQNAVCVD